MDYLRFFKQNKRLISFGFLLTFFSSFGQTFLISLYVPDIMKEFGMANSAFGSVYGAATIASSFLLAYIGKFIDGVNLRTYTLGAAVLLIAATLTLAFSINILFIFAGFLGLRLAGQGLLSHISNTSISKFFDKTRGKALSLTVLGYSTGEGIFPVIIGITIGLVGWRYSMGFHAAAILLVLIPFVILALNKKEYQYFETEEKRKQKTDDGFSRKMLFRDRNFYIIAFNSSVIPFLATGLFFYQLVMAEEKGWSVELLSTAFIGFAIGRTVFSLVSGKLIDKYSASAIFPWYLLPFSLGLLTITFFDFELAAYIYLILTGITVGISTPSRPAVIAEVYGTRYLGGIKAVFSTLMVLSTALSPALFGYLLDRNIGFASITAMSFVLVIAATLVSTRLAPQYSAVLQRE